MGRSRTRSQKAATAISPGKSVQRKTFRKEWPVTSRSQRAVSGPPMAPTVSIRRSRPKARPKAFGGTSAASMVKLERPSAMPSIAPSQAGPAPMAARNAGRIAVAVSWLQSLNRLVRPTPRTVRLSQDCFSWASGMVGQFTVESSKLKVQSLRDSEFDQDAKLKYCRPERRRQARRTPKLFLCGAVEDDANFFEGDEAAVNHLVEAWENFFDALVGLDDFENDGKILREAEKLVRVIDAGTAVAADASQH